MKRIQVRLFRIAAILQILIAAGHVIGHFAMPRPANETEAKLIAMMSSYNKDVAGGKMSILDSYDGLNLTYGLFFLLTGAVNLTIQKNNAGLVKPISLINATAMGVGAAVALAYFFWIPVLYFAVTCILFTVVRFSNDREAD